MDSRKKIAIMIPVYDHVPAKSFGNIIGFLTETAKKFQVSILITDSTHVTLARNILLENFLKTDSEYALFIDSDMILPPNTLEELLSHDKDVISALYLRKAPPYYPVCMKSIGEEKYEIITQLPESSEFEVDATGLGCFLVKREVIEKVAKTKPVFTMENKPDLRVKSEDTIFCEKIKKAGYKIWVSRKATAGHFGAIIAPAPYNPK